MYKQQKESGMPIFQLLRIVRDARAHQTPAQGMLLYALALRCRTDENFSCFPSYSVLARDTGLHSGSCKRLIKNLEDADLIRRKIRSNHSNKFFVNIVKLSGMAKANLLNDKKELEAGRARAAKEDNPFGVPEDGVADDAGEQVLDHDAEAAEYEDNGGGSLFANGGSL